MHKILDGKNNQKDEGRKGMILQLWYYYNTVTHTELFSFLFAFFKTRYVRKRTRMTPKKRGRHRFDGFKRIGDNLSNSCLPGFFRVIRFIRNSDRVLNPGRVWCRKVKPSQQSWKNSTLVVLSGLKKIIDQSMQPGILTGFSHRDSFGKNPVRV